MDRVSYGEVIKRIIGEYAPFKPAYGDVDAEVVLDDEHGHYELSWIGWDGWRRVHGTLIHVDIRGDKVWIQHVGTEDGIAEELVAAGIPRDRIVLGFQHPFNRLFMEYAQA